MKKKSDLLFALLNSRRRTLLIMKQLVLFIFVLNLQVSASVFSQQKVTLKLKNATLKECIKAIEKQTDLGFLYNGQELNAIEGLDLEVSDREVQEVLGEVLANTGYTFVIEKNVILIQKTVPVILSNEVTQPDKKTLKGAVVDAETNQPLVGVNVYVKGTTLGTITDENGQFEFKVPDEPGWLVFSFIGFEDQEISLVGKTSFSVVMIPVASSVDEVVVYASGLTKISKERATGSYSVMSRSEILTSPNEEIGKSLEGNIAGLQENFNPTTGQMEIAIRGISTINSVAKPLIVVDGFPVEGDFSTINPNDVENITVLKDAAAASIWGARAGNGVIVITTRKAKKGEKMKIDFNSYLKIGEEFDFDYNLPRASNEAQLAYEKYQVGIDPNITDGLVENITKGLVTRSKGQQAYFDYKRGVISKNALDNTINTLMKQDYRKDVNKYLLRRPVTQQYHLSIKNRGERSSTYLSVFYNKSDKVWKNNDEQKVLINFRNSYNIRDWIEFNAGIVTEIKKKETAGVNLNMLRDMSPYETLVNPDGSYSQVNHMLNYPYMNTIARSANGLPYENWAYNPLQETLNRDYTRNYINTRFHAGFNIDVIDGLTFTPKFQYERFYTKCHIYNNENTFYARNEANYNVEYDEASNKVLKQYVPSGGILWQNFNTDHTYDLRNQINFDKILFEDHEINIVAAVEHIWKIKNSFA
ncbi:MAG: carboxypeptidase-like regulatory domain-containing protein, partial [Marinilabiliaceae bacterium]|nr:carboxypeptidase-like regulatory domain-containing protein [Marinilabiliaceae bacterium]